jgi:hypothetical protein
VTVDPALDAAANVEGWAGLLLQERPSAQEEARLAAGVGVLLGAEEVYLLSLRTQASGHVVAVRKVHVSTGLADREAVLRVEGDSFSLVAVELVARTAVLGDASPASPARTEPYLGADPTPPVWWGDGWGWTLVGSGALTLGVATWSFLHAGGLRTDDRMLEVGERKRRGDEADDFDSLGYSALAAGAALAIAGAVKLAIVSPAPARHARHGHRANAGLRVGGMSTRGGFALGIYGSFP